MPDLAAFTWDNEKMGQPEVDSYQIRRRGAFERREQTEGPPRYPKVTDAQASQGAAITCIMTHLQFQYFEGFWFHYLQRGANWFLMKLQTASGFTNYDCHMTGPYSATLLGGDDLQGSVWQVTFDIEFIYSAVRGNFPAQPPAGADNDWVQADYGKIEVDGYTLKPPENNIISQMADGPPIFRQTRNSGPTTVSCVAIMRRQQFINFQGWFYYTLDQGVGGFDLRIRTGRGATDQYRMHFTEGYTARQIQGEKAWEISFDATYGYSANNFPVNPADVIFAGPADTPSTDGEIHGGTPTDPGTDGEVHAPDIGDLVGGAFAPDVMAPGV